MLTFFPLNRPSRRDHGLQTRDSVGILGENHDRLDGREPYFIRRFLPNSLREVFLIEPRNEGKLADAQ